MLLGGCNQPLRCKVLNAGEVDSDTRVERMPLELREQTPLFAADGHKVHLRRVLNRRVEILGLRLDILQ